MTRGAQAPMALADDEGGRVAQLEAENARLRERMAMIADLAGLGACPAPRTGTLEDRQQVASGVST